MAADMFAVRFGALLGLPPRPARLENGASEIPGSARTTTPFPSMCSTNDPGRGLEAGRAQVSSEEGVPHGLERPFGYRSETQQAAQQGQGCDKGLRQGRGSRGAKSLHMFRGTPLLVAAAAFILVHACLGVSAFIVRPSTAIARLVQRFSLKRIVMSGDHQDAEVVVVGSCNMDLMTYTPRLPIRGEKAAESFGVSNAAVRNVARPKCSSTAVCHVRRFRGERS